MAALPAFQLNMIAKVINAGTGEIVPEADWVSSFTNHHPVTVQFQDGSYIIWSKGQVIFTQDVLEAVKTSFAKFVCTVEKLRNVREQEKALKAELKGFYYKEPKTIGDLLKQELAAQRATDAKGLPTMVDLRTLCVGDVVKLRNGSYMYIETVKQQNPGGSYMFSVNTTAYTENGRFYTTQKDTCDIVQIIKKGSKLLSNAQPGDLVLETGEQNPWTISSIKKQQGNTYFVRFKHGIGICYNNDGTAYESSYYNDIILL